MNSSEVCQLFFTEIAEGNYRCKCGSTRKRKKTAGYTNLMSHLKEKHPDWEQVYAEFKKSNPGKKKAAPGQIFFVNPKVIQLHSWLTWIVNRNLPLSVVETKEFRDYSCLDSIGVDTLTKYLRLVDMEIEKNLKDELPQRFGLLIDGWTEGTTHYYGLFAAYRKGTVNYQRFLTISPPFDETEYGAISQASFIVDTVEAFDRTKESILFLVGDNTNTNPATATKLGVPFIGCASHRFNLAVQSYLDTYDEIITSINNLMKVLTNVKKAGKLRMNTPLEPVTRNVTRWSSTYSMVERFFRLKEHLDQSDVDLLRHIPSGPQVVLLEALRKDLKTFDTVTKRLQLADISLLDVRLIFDELVKNYPSMSSRLGADARIVKFPYFESGICKVIDGQEEHLSLEESTILSQLKLEYIDLSDSNTETIDLVERALKKRRKKNTLYMDLTFIPPTSNVVERSFSAARYFFFYIG
jgi:hypothetical protein